MLLYFFFFTLELVYFFEFDRSCSVLKRRTGTHTHTYVIAHKQVLNHNQSVGRENLNQYTNGSGGGRVPEWKCTYDRDRLPASSERLWPPKLYAAFVL